MEDIVVTKLAKLLSKDSIVLQNWTLFYAELGLPLAEAKILRQSYISGLITEFDLFQQIFQNWNSVNGIEAQPEKLEVILRNLGFNAAADKLNVALKDIPTSSNSVALNNPLRHNYSPVVINYVGRKSLESEILESITTISENNCHFPVVVLWGIGGNGKTTLARRIVQICHEQSLFGGNSIWINAEREESIIQEFSDLFKISKETQTKQEVQKQLKEQILTKDFHCLIVYDNVDDYKMMFGYLPLNKETNVSVIITSNAECDFGDWGKPKNISIEKFTKEEFSEYVKKKITDATGKCIEVLDEYTGRIPYLANIVCSGFAARKKLYPIEDISEYLEVKGDDFLSGEENTNLFFTYLKSPKEIVERQMNIIKNSYKEDGKLAYGILCLLAYCHPEINKEQLTKLFIRFKNLNPDQKKIKKAVEIGLNILIEQGFIQNQTENIFYIYNYLSIHRLHQHSIRTILREQRKETLLVEEILNIDSDIIINKKLLWEIMRESELLEKFINSHILMEKMRILLTEEIVKDLLNYMKGSRSKDDYFRWLFFDELPRGWLRKAMDWIRLCQRNDDWSKKRENIPSISLFGQPLRLMFFNLENIFVNFEELICDVKMYLDKENDRERRTWVENRLGEWIFETVKICEISYLKFIKDNLPYLFRSKLDMLLKDSIKDGRGIGIVKWLVENGGDINAVNAINNNIRETPLFIAVNCKSLDIVEYLISKGANVNEIDNFEYSPLQYAVRNENLEMVECLITNGAEIEGADNTRTSPLHIAVRNGNLKIVKYLISKGANVNASDNFNTKLIEIAVRNGNFEIVKCLISNGADVNASDNLSTDLLIMAVRIRHLEIVKFLYSNQADVNASDNLSTHLLEIAVRGGNLEIVKYLISKGADVNATDNLSTNFLEIAVRARYLEIVKCLISNGADVNAKSKYPNTLLHFVVDFEEFQFFKKILIAGADPNIQNNDGATPLMLAASRGQTEFVELLLEHNADTELQDKNGKRAMDFAKKGKFLEIEELILAYHNKV